MIGRIIEVASDGIHLSSSRGFMVLSEGREEKGRVALDDLSALVVHGHGATFSANLVARLAERGVPMVICDKTHSPAAFVWPVNGHFEQGLRMEQQALAGKPLKKRIWKALMQAKIEAQGKVLDAVGENGNPLRDMSKRVRSGDPENIEAQAARRYWRLMMGDEFRRDRNEAGVNAMLNYAYMILRAGTARSIIAAGLHPSLSIHHVSRGQPLRLADDLMEPFRAYVDLHVRNLALTHEADLNPQTKTRLASILTLDLAGPKGASPMQACLDRLATSLAQVFMGERKDLELPGPPLELRLSNWF
jgi:CRISPR-associated protein Cas1